MACSDRPPILTAEVMDDGDVRTWVEATADGVAIWQSSEDRETLECVGLLWRDVPALRQALTKAEMAHRAHAAAQGEG